MAGNERLLSVHIPKTGGISLQKFWMDLYGPEHVYIYNGEGFVRSDLLPGAKRLNPKAERIKIFLYRNPIGQKLYPVLRKALHRMERTVADPDPPKDFSVIHGHFMPHQVEVSNPKLVTVLRNPLARTISHYRFLLSSAKKGDKTPEWLDSASFADFIRREEFINFQAKYLGLKGPSGLWQIGITEELEAYCRIFDPKGSISLPKLNIGVARFPNIEQVLVEEFKEENKTDYKLYKEAQNRSLAST